MSHQRHDAFDTKRIRRNAAELRALWGLPLTDLPWPRNLYQDHSGLVAAQALQHQHSAKLGDLCTCGKEHRKLYPRTRKSDYGNGFNVTYYCSNTCKSNAVRAEGGTVNGG